jgi:hypothetical protein
MCALFALLFYGVMITSLIALAVTLIWTAWVWLTD